MSWQIGCLAVLGLVLVSGFAWYERSHPPARLLALVATLAALGVAGRVALAPIPNVVATTDVVLFAGYALGAAPGFAVGALAALISNFWLGQGPWTLWQMAAWGLVGLAGAGLAAVFGRELKRVALALAAALAGLAYGALLDLSAMVNYGGEQSLDRYLALSARGVPFNLAHAIGNAAIALAVGPAFVAMLIRFRDRATIVWHDQPAGGLVAVLVALVVAFGVFAAEDAEAGLSDASGFMRAVQNSDGGFGPDVGDPSSPAMTGWAALGLEAAGINPQDLRHSGSSPIDYLRARVNSLDSTGDLERTILAVEGAGLDARNFGGRDLVADLVDRRSGNSWGGQVNLTAYGILALGAAGQGGVTGSARWLANARNDDNGWGFAPGAASDPDSTGAALEALALAGGHGEAVAKGAGFLRRSQRSDGGWALGASTGSNSQSAALAVQGLLAAGVSPNLVRSGGRSGIDFLNARQDPDGRVDYARTSGRTPVWVTAQAMLAFASKTLPLAPVPRAPRAAGPPQRPRSASGGSNGHKRGDSGSKTEKSGATDKRSAEKSAGKTRAGVSDTGSPAAGVATKSIVEDQVEAAVGNAAGSESENTSVIIAGLVILAGLLAGGFFFYRRRLPPV